jgi:hypothetical protein
MEQLEFEANEWKSTPCPGLSLGAGGDFVPYKFYLLPYGAQDPPDRPVHGAGQRLRPYLKKYRQMR